MWTTLPLAFVLLSVCITIEGIPVRPRGTVTTTTSATTISNVHVIFANHLDVGFDGIDPTVGFAVNIVNKYFQQYFPDAVAIAKEMRAQNKRYIYTTHAWLVSLYLDCSNSSSFFPSPPISPPISLACPTPEAVNEFVDCIVEGDITWHAFPFNMQLSMMDSSFLSVAAQFVHDLDAMFNQSLKRTLSQRDVPGITLGALSSLNGAGIQAVSIGVNGGSAPPDVPTIFVWKDNTTGAQVLAMWHPGGYGDINKEDCVTIPGFTDALAFAWRGDNGGPGDVTYVNNVFSTLSKEFPDANVFASTFDDFVEKVLPLSSTLPVVTSEIGDSWMYGVPSDPWKVQMWREIMRIHNKYTSAESKRLGGSGGGRGSGAADFNSFYRLLLKVPEHTWGLDVKTFLNDTTNWSNVNFQAQRNESRYILMQNSWDEQRQYIYNAIKALGSDPLAREIVDSLNSLRVTDSAPDLLAYNYVELWKPAMTFDCGEWTTSFGINGGVSYLKNTRTQKIWAGQGHILGEYVYTTFDGEDFTGFTADYCYCSPSTCSEWIPLDFGKPNVEVAKPVKGEWRGTTRSVYTFEDATTCSYYLYTPFYRVLYVDYGSPRYVWTQINITKTPSASPALKMNFRVYGKTPTRLPEAHWILFNPSVLPPSHSPRSESASVPLGAVEAVGAWWVDKCGQLVNPMDVVLNGSMHLHGQIDGVLYKGTDASLHLSALDLSVVSFGNVPNPFPTPFIAGDPTDGIYFNVFNNIWGTNYVMWYPWREDDANGLYRFEISLE